MAPTTGAISHADGMAQATQWAAAREITTTLVAESTVRVGRMSVFYVQYANVGDDDAPAPLLTLSSPLDVPMTLDSTETPQALSLEVLAVNPNGPLAVLSPGAKGRFAVYFMPSAQGPFTFEVRATDPSDASLLTAEDLQDNVLSAIPANDESAANGPGGFHQFQQIVGAHVGFVCRTRWTGHAPLLPLTKGNPGIPLDVLQLAINQRRRKSALKQAASPSRRLPAGPLRATP